MRQITVVFEIVQRAAGRGDHIDIGNVGGDQNDGRAARAPTSESDPAEEQTDCRVGEVVHEVWAGIPIVRGTGEGKGDGWMPSPE